MTAEINSDETVTVRTMRSLDLTVGIQTPEGAIALRKISLGSLRGFGAAFDPRNPESTGKVISRVGPDAPTREVKVEETGRMFKILDPVPAAISARMPIRPM